MASKNQWLDLLNRPGAHSDDPEFNWSKATTFKSPFSGQIFSGADVMADMIKSGTISADKINAGKISGISADYITMDEMFGNDNKPTEKEEEVDMAEKMSEQVELATLQLCSDINAGIKLRGNDGVFTLNGPETLTVMMQGKGGFRKESHIGGEEFALGEVYVGKKGALIGKFKPLATSSYQYAEIQLDEACQKMQTLSDGLDILLGHSYMSRKGMIAAVARQEKEQAQLEEKRNDYEGFGSW